MFEENSMLYFKTLDGCLKYIRGLDIYGGWKINDGLMNDRGKHIENKTYVNELRNTFNAKRLFHKSVAISEIVTWLDSFIHLTRIIEYLQKINQQEILSDTQVIFEYVIEMSKLSRIDVIFKYKKRLCLIEFSLVNSFTRMKKAYQNKRIELMIYKDLMLNYLPNDYKVVVLPFISLYEYKDKKTVKKHLESNLKQAEFAARYIDAYILK